MSNNMWRKKAAVTAAAALTLSLALAGCGGKDTNSASPSAAATATVQPAATAAVQATPPAATQAASKTVYPLKLKDATGVEITFDKAPEKIVTLAPSETESVYAAGAGAKIVAVDKWSDYPAEAKSKAQIGDLNSNMEAVVAAGSDVVFASAGVNKKAVEALRALNVKVFASDPKTLQQAIDRVELFGQILNTQAEAKKAADEMRADLKKVTDAVKNAPKKRVYIEFSPGWTVGSGEFMDEIVTLAGGINIGADKKGWYKIDPEAIIKANPEVIVYAKGEAGMGSILEEINKRPGWDAIDAMKNKKQYAVDSNLVSRVGPRVTKGLIEVAKAIHPDEVK
ncbi:ABC transporter substrate-binding protein [Gorillibacterium sp. sgz5001074]|uniref:ABC transporter substrate-binding protein n=1 Tax=Gorillibacterium sp. sgz5001074 TaxID=3446695 RepID=UPI003F6651A3